MNEIEEFLKRAAAMRAKQQGSQPVTPPPPAPRPVPPAPLSRRSPSSLVQDAEVIDAEEVTAGDDVASHVAIHLNTRSFGDRTSHLGEGIKAADEVIESHLHQTFEHRLGTLGATTARADDSTLDEDEAAAARSIIIQSEPQSFAAMLRSPQNLRNAIILNEILNPPRARW